MEIVWTVQEMSIQKFSINPKSCVVFYREGFRKKVPNEVENYAIMDYLTGKL